MLHEIPCRPRFILFRAPQEAAGLASIIQTVHLGRILERTVFNGGAIAPNVLTLSTLTMSNRLGSWAEIASEVSWLAKLTSKYLERPSCMRGLHHISVARLQHTCARRKGPRVGRNVTRAIADKVHVPFDFSLCVDT